MENDSAPQIDRDGSHPMPDPIDLIHELHTALHGSSWARSESPKWVWELLLDQVSTLVADAAATRSALRQLLDALGNEWPNNAFREVEAARVLVSDVSPNKDATPERENLRAGEYGTGTDERSAGSSD